MSLRTKVIALLLIVASQSVAAQLPASENEPVCSRGSSSRVADPACTNEKATKPITVQIINEQEMALRLKPSVIEVRGCAAKVSLQYSQRNTVAKVDGLIENAACTMSSGEFVVTASIRDQNGNMQRLQFPQAWESSESHEVPFSAEYPIGADVDLVRVGAGNMRCSCE